MLQIYFFETTSRRMVILESVREVIDALGGLAAVAKLTGVDPGTASAWQTRLGYFPPKTFLVVRKALAKRGLSAPASLWKMVPAQEPGASFDVVSVPEA
jgi:hypothetical protein